MRKHGREILALGMVLLLAGLVLWRAGIYFETNDDRFVTEILSGSITGEPQAHATHSNYLLSLPLSWLYRLSSDIPWYGGFLILCHLLAYFLILVGILERCTGGKEWIVGIGMGVIVLLAAVYLFGAIQYTSTAAVLGIAGYVCLLLWKDERKGLICFFGLELLSLFLRDKAMLLIQPLGAAVLLGFFLAEKGYRQPIRWKRLGGWAGAVVLVLCIGQLGQMAGYASPEWREYRRFNQAREELFDFYGVPAYEEVREILDRHQVTEIGYEAFLHYMILEDSINADCLEELVAYRRSHDGVEQVPLRTLIHRIGGAWLKEDYLGENIQALVLWVAVIVLVLFLKRFILLLPLGGLACAQTLVWAYMLYRGRVPYRVTLPLFFGEILLLLVILLRDENRRREKSEGRLLTGLCVLLIGISCWSGWTQLEHLRQANDRQEAYMADFRRVQQYCLEHPENRYLLDALTFSIYQGSALETEIYGARNSMYSGSWYSHSPALNQYRDSYLGTGHEGIYYITAEKEPDMQMPPLLYLTEWTGTVPVLQDAIPLPQGSEYLVYYLGNEAGTVVE